jgi:hypothetical protein
MDQQKILIFCRTTFSPGKGSYLEKICHLAQVVPFLGGSCKLPSIIPPDDWGSKLVRVWWEGWWVGVAS